MKIGGISCFQKDRAYLPNANSDAPGRDITDRFSWSRVETVDVISSFIPLLGCQTNLTTATLPDVGYSKTPVSRRLLGAAGVAANLAGSALGFSALQGGSSGGAGLLALGLIGASGLACALSLALRD